MINEAKEREDQFNRFLATGSQALEDLKGKIDETKIKYDALIKEKEIQIASTSSNESLKVELEDLKRQQALASDVAKTVTAVWPTLNSIALSGIFGGETIHKCSKCNFGFKVRNTQKGFMSSAFDSASVTCPSCGNIDFI